MDRLLFIVLPSLALLFCNISLVRTLNISKQLHRNYRVHHKAGNSQNRITLVLFLIALGFVVLVFPCEVMDIFMGLFPMDQHQTEVFLTVRVVANTLQMLNFSCNFLLYCALNSQFRRKLKELILCKKQSERYMSMTSLHRQSTRRSQNNNLPEQPPTRTHSTT